MSPSEPAETGFELTPLTTRDLGALADLHAQVFGPGRFARSAYRVREGGRLFSPACRKIMRNGEIVGAVQMTRVVTHEAERAQGDARGMLLGPLVVAPDYASLGHGRRLVAAACEAAFAGDAGYVLLVGDLAYYARAAFQRVPGGRIQLPGPVDPARLLIRLRGETEGLPAGRVVGDAPARGLLHRSGSG